MALGKDNLPCFRRVKRGDPPRLAKGVPPPRPNVPPDQLPPNTDPRPDDEEGDE